MLISLQPRSSSKNQINCVNQPGPTVHRLPEVFIIISSLVYKPIPLFVFQNRRVIKYHTKWLYIVLKRRKISMTRCINFETGMKINVITLLIQSSHYITTFGQNSYGFKYKNQILLVNDSWVKAPSICPISIAGLSDRPTSIKISASSSLCCPVKMSSSISLTAIPYVIQVN